MDSGPVSGRTDTRQSWRLAAPHDAMTQGLVVSGFASLPTGRALFLRIKAEATRSGWLRALGDVAPITDADGRDPAAAAIAFTHAGLVSMGLPQAALALYLDRVALLPVTPFTLTERDTVAQAIHVAGERGYCFVDQEAEHGFRSVAIPLRKFNGTVAVALNIGTRLEHANEAAMTGHYLAILRREAAMLSGCLI